MAAQGRSRSNTASGGHSASLAHRASSQYLTRSPSFDAGDDYFDGGTGVARRPSVQQPQLDQDDYYPQQQPGMNNPRRLSIGMAERTQSPGTYFAVAPPPTAGNNGHPYSPGYPSSYDSATPYPTNPGYNGTAQHPPAHQPYNPAAYQPQRAASGTNYTPPEYRPQRTATAAGQFSPNPASYNPSAFTNTPYPTQRPGPGQPSLQMPSGGGHRPYGGFAQFPVRPQYPPNTSYMSPQQPYSPGLPPPPPPQSAPAQHAYHPPPPPPPPHPPQSPGYPQTSYSSQSYSPGQSTLSHGSSQKTYLSRPETHYNSGSESDLSMHGDDAPHHPLPSPPKERPNPGYDDYRSQPLPSPPPPAPPSHGSLRQHSGSRHPHSRPLPNAPDEARQREEAEAAESLYRDVEESLAELGRPPNYQSQIDGGRMPAPLFASGHQRNGTATNGHHMSLSGVYAEYYSNDSDAEAAAGLEQMQRDEDLAIELDKRASQDHSLSPPPPDQGGDSDLDYGAVGMDLGMFGGEIPGGMSGFYGPEGVYGKDDVIPIKEDHNSPPPPPPKTEIDRAHSGASTSSRQQGGTTYSPLVVPEDEDPFQDAAVRAARVDTWGTGGLSEPSQQRRMSFDEGDENIDRSQSQSPIKRPDSDDDEFPELFYHPPPSASSIQSTSPLLSRPLPSPPYNDYVPELRPAGTPAVLPYPDGPAPLPPRPGMPYQPMSPEAMQQAYANSQGPQIPRAISLSSHTSSPQTIPPVRSKTDGKVHPKSNRSSVINTPAPIGIGEDLTPSLRLEDLPPIPLTRKFDPKKLSSRDFKRCQRPWALSAISAWVREMTEGEQDLKEAAVAEGVSALFTHYVPTMNVADAETLAAKVVGGMLKERALVKEEEWVKFGDGVVSGVIYQITGNGCYSPRLHEIDCPGRCYSHHCARTLRKIALPQHLDEKKQKMEDWATFWKLKKEDIADVNKKEVERQNNLHEIVQTEEEYVDQLRVLKVVYRDQVASSDPPMIKPTRLEGFVRDVFGKADAVRIVSEEHLLPQIKFRQREQGPWVVGFSDIFREWIRKAKTAYLEYAAAFPKADMLVRREAERNLLFRQFLDNCRQDPRTKRLDWVTYLKGPITRLQRYSLLLSTVLKHTLVESEEKDNLERAIEEIKAVTMECDQRVDEMSKRIQLIELGQKLIMRSQWEVDLRLEEMGRELIFKGDLQRTGSNRFTWLETHAILFDHYLVLSKTTLQRDVHGGAKHERYDVSRMPIPMDLLVLESTDDDPVVRNAANRLGIAGPTAAAKDRGDGGGSRHNTMNTVPTLQSMNSSVSVNSTATAPGRLVTALPDQNARDEKVMYPFRIKHLGNPSRYQKSDGDNTYILYAPSSQNRQDWCQKILMAKEKHAQSLHDQNAEPFRLRIMADAAFSYDSYTASSTPKPIRVRGTPLDRAVIEVEEMFEDQQRPNPICRASVNCATAFTAQFGKEMVAVGTDFGVYVSEANNPRGWTKAISTSKVTQIAVLEDFSLFLVLADKALIAYHLDNVVPPPGNSSTTTKQRPPQKLSGGKDVGFFATGRMKERSLVFYKKRDGLSSTFKVLEPVFQKATEKKSRFSRKGTTEFFREFDEFYIPTETYGINLFHSSLAIQTSKGLEVMTLDKKRPWSVPELRASHVSDIAQRLQNQKPLGMFRLSDIEFLLCYEECAVYVNKHGDVSRSVIMEFVGKARMVAMYGPYVLIFDSDFVEIRNAQNGRLRQVIAGRDVRCLDDAMSGGSAGKRRVKVAMAHPHIDGTQLVIELVLNEGQRD